MAYLPCMDHRSAADHPMIRALQPFGPLTPQAAEALAGITERHVLPKGHHLLRLWQVQRQFYFIEKGAGRVYYLHDGQDVSDYFALDNQFLGGLESLFTRQPSHKAIELLEDSIVHAYAYDAFETLCAEYHEIERLGRRMATYAFLQGQRRVESIRFLSAAERYAELEKTHPGISNRIPLKHLASFLGITQVSLSRIRSGQQ
ncbi:MAG: Crp/Fnr family transcriptional regulator [Hyphomicrobiales bacterium]